MCATTLFQLARAPNIKRAEHQWLGVAMMKHDQSSDELSDMIGRHSRAIRDIRQLEIDVIWDVSRIPELRSLRDMERVIRRRVVECQPPSRKTALAKFQHLFGVILLLKASLDDDELAHLSQDHQRFGS